MVWNPQKGNQTSAFLADWCDVLLFGGERGGGKSDFQLGYQEDAALRYGGKSRGIMFRKTYGELEELQARAKEIFEPSGGVYKTHASADYSSSNCWYFPNGATIKMRYIESPKDYERYHGHQYSHVSLDEVGEYINPMPLDKMISTMRSAHGVPCSMRLTANPGGVGNSWLRSRFIDVAPPYAPWIDKDDGLTYMHIPSKTDDNQVMLSSDPRYKNRLLAATKGNEELRKAWMLGRWDIVAGAFFSQFDREQHVIKPFHIPAHWTRIRAFDWGRASPFACVWAAVSDGEATIEHNGNDLTIPRGALVFYREWYGMKPNKPNVGLLMNDADVAHGIVKRSRGEKFATENSVADPSIFNVVTGESISEIYRKNGVTFIKADNSRISGWAQLHLRLAGTDESEGHPMIYFFDTMRETIRTLPLLQHDDTNIEDLDTDQEDHAADAVRYACMTRPIVTDAKKSKKAPRWVDPYVR